MNNMIIDLTLSSKANMYKHSGSTRRQVVNGLLVIGDLYHVVFFYICAWLCSTYLNRLFKSFEQ